MFKVLRKRPFVGILLAFALGIVAAGVVNLNLTVVAVVLVIFIVIAKISKENTQKTIYTFASVVLAGALVAVILTPKNDIPRGKKLFFEINIENFSLVRARWDLATARINHYAADDTPMVWRPTRARVNIYADTSVHIASGERMVVSGYLNPVRSTSRSFVRLMASRSLTDNLFITSEDNVVLRSREDAVTLRRLSGRLNAYAMAQIDQLELDSAASSLAKAMTVGSKVDMDPELKSAYSLSGTAHLLAVSGLHTGFVFLMLSMLLWWMPMVRSGHIYKPVIVTMALWGFVLMAGMSASVVRAAIMLSIFELSRGLSRKVDRYNVLCSSAVVMLAVNPMWLYDISFQMSFAAVLSIFVFMPPLLQLVSFKNKYLKYAASVMVVGIAAQIGVVPLLCLNFGVLPVVGLVITPLLLLPTFVIIATTLLWICVPLPLLGGVCAAVINCAAGLCNSLVVMAAKWRWAVINLQINDTFVLIYYLAVILIVCVVVYRKHRKQLKGQL